MNEEKVTELIKIGEQSNVDFKQIFDLKAFSDDKNEKKIAIGKIVKDIVAISNSLVNGFGYIIYGVNEHTREILNVEKMIDDAELQNQLEKYVFPKPICTIGRLVIEDNNIGYCEIKTPLIFPSVFIKSIQNVFYEGQIWKRDSTKNKVCLFEDIKQQFNSDYKTFEKMDNPFIKNAESFYKDQGYTVSYTRYTDIDNKMLDGWELAIYPGTKQKIGFIHNDKIDLVMIIKRENK